MDNSTRRGALRNETAAAHQALDDMIGGFGDREAYARYLLGMARFRLPVEAWLRDAAVSNHLGDWRPEFYGRDIMDDLGDLGMERPAAVADFTPPSGDGVIGLLYVLEGSALGARLLAKRAEKLGLTEDFAARHIFRQARNLSSWRTFSERMEKVWAYDDRAATAWANSTFAYARNAFESAS